MEAFSAQGARVAFLDVDVDAAAALDDGIASGGHPRPWFRRTDLSDLADLDAAITEAAAALGDIEILLNNAANDQRHTLTEVTPEMFDANVAVNLRHLVFAAKAVAPAMKRRGGGVIINTGSMSWRAGFTGMPLYVMAKAAIEGLTRGLARELGGDGIRVNSLIPGWVMTDKQLRLWVDDEAKALIARSQCLPGSVMPEDLARMATFLASDDSRMITSQSFVVDGGWL